MLGIVFSSSHWSVYSAVDRLEAALADIGHPLTRFLRGTHEGPIERTTCGSGQRNSYGQESPSVPGGAGLARSPGPIGVLGG